MRREDRKAAIAAYKERKAPAGIFMLRCDADGACWVGRSPNLDTAENRLWFMLRGGSVSRKSLQTAWNAHGAAAFRFEVLEILDDDLRPSARDRELKDRQAHWLRERGAEAI